MGMRTGVASGVSWMWCWSKFVLPMGLLGVGSIPGCFLNRDSRAILYVWFSSFPFSVASFIAFCIDVSCS